MKYLELLAKCMTLINQYGNHSSCILQLPRVTRAAQIKLAGRTGPYGKILSENEGVSIVAFPARKVVEWIIRNNRPHTCFICGAKGDDYLPWVLNVQDATPTAVFTCRNCPHLADHLKQRYNATIYSISEAIGHGGERFYQQGTN